MSDKKAFLAEEKNKYGKIYVDITYGIDNISPFLESSELKGKRFVKKVDVLRKYIQLIEAADAEKSKGGLFNIFKEDHSLDLLKSYKNGNVENFIQLENCSKCSCLNCTSKCNFDACDGCRPGSYIKYCDHKKINVTIHSNYILELTNDKTGNQDSYRVLATLEDCQLEQKYIIIESIYNKEKFVLYYYPGISEDNYGEISDAEEFDFIIESFENADLT